jgi:hypothetical protein
MTEASLGGSLFVLYLYDVCDEIRLEEVRRIVGARTVERTFKHPAPEYVGFVRPPVVEPLEPVLLEGGERLDGHIKYYDYGVISVLFELPFSGNWESLVRQAGGWMSGVEFERHAGRIADEKLKQAAPALIKPYPNRLSEDYFVFHLAFVSEDPLASELLARHGGEITQIIRGETIPLADDEKKEVLNSSLSYYPSDLVVVGWHAALVYDSAAGAANALQLLEYSNSQLLEFRYYDELLTRELDGVYQSLDRGTGFLARWRMAGAASRLNTVTLEVTELTERADNAMKFLSDMFSARLYRLSAAKVGVPDYKDLVNRKLQTARGLYGFMVNEFHQSRGFALEIMVVVILIIELVFLFRGKP